MENVDSKCQCYGKILVYESFNLLNCHFYVQRKRRVGGVGWGGREKITDSLGRGKEKERRKRDPQTERERVHLLKVSGENSK